MTTANISTEESYYLKLSLGAGIKAVLPMAQIQEVVTIAKEIITPIPCMPSCVLGLVNQRSRVIWVVDLRKFLGLSIVIAHGSECGLVIIRVNNNPLGLVVPSIEEVISIPAESIIPAANNIPPDLTPYVTGYNSEEGYYILDGQKIINAELLNTF